MPAYARCGAVHHQPERRIPVHAALVLAMGLLAPCALAANQPPVANAGPDRTVQVNTSVAFDGSASHDPDGTVAQYYFNWGDGTWTGWQSNAVVAHTYTALGTYTLKLWVKDNLGALSPYDSAVITVRDQPAVPPIEPGALDPWRARLVQVQESALAGLDRAPEADNECPNNLPPTANAGPDRQGQAGVPVVFSFSAGDPDGTIVWYQVNFGDGQVQSGATLPPATHTYAAAGTYIVTLTVTDGCGASAADTATATIAAGDPPGLSADFLVRALVYVDPATGAEEWHTYDLATEDIELGLRVVFDATASTGAYYYCYSFGDGTYNGDIYSPLAQHAYSAAGGYTVRLTVYDQAGTPAQIQKQVYVAGMELGSTTPFPSMAFYPALRALRGTHLWSVSTSGHIGMTDIADPYNLPRIQIMPHPAFDQFCDMALSESPPGAEKLYVARGTCGVEVFRADPTAFTRLDSLCLLPADLAAQSAWAVAALGDLLYVATGFPDQLLTFDMGSSGAPILLSTLTFPQGLGAMALAGNRALVIQSGNYALAAVDLRQPTSPQISATAPTSSRLMNSIRACEQTVAACALAGTLLFGLSIPTDPAEPITFGPQRTFAIFPTHYAVTDGRLYVHGGASILKYDVADPKTGPYQMEAVRILDDAPLTFALHDAGARLPSIPSLFAGVNAYGFRSFIPTAPGR